MNSLYISLRICSIASKHIEKILILMNLSIYIFTNVSYLIFNYCILQLNNNVHVDAYVDVDKTAWLVELEDIEWASQ